MNTALSYQMVMDCPVAGGGTRIGVRVDDDAVQALDLLQADIDLVPAGNRVARNLQAQLLDYFEHRRQTFSVPLRLRGTPFQLRVWEYLRRIPWGATRSYGEVARDLSTSARAVGNACRSNPTPLLVPCHRVVAAHGPGGFMGATGGSPMDLKAWLLNHEQGV